MCFISSSAFNPGSTFRDSKSISRISSLTRESGNSDGNFKHCHKEKFCDIRKRKYYIWSIVAGWCSCCSCCSCSCCSCSCCSCYSCSCCSCSCSCSLPCSCCSCSCCSCSCCSYSCCFCCSCCSCCYCSGCSCCSYS